MSNVVAVIALLAQYAPALKVGEALTLAHAIDNLYPAQDVPFNWSAASTLLRADEVERTIPAVLDSLRDGKKIQAIKEARTAVQAQGYPMGLKEAKDVVDLIDERHGGLVRQAREAEDARFRSFTTTTQSGYNCCEECG